MLEKIAAWSINMPEVPGKGKIVTLALRLTDGKVVRSRYGPLMRVRGRDLTNIFSISGMNKADYDDVYNEVRTLRPGMAFLDIGANVGLFSLIAAEIVGPSGVVIAFEPSLKVFRDLVDNATLNGLNNFFPFNAAIANNTKISKFASGKNEHSGKAHLSAEGDISVLQLSFDEYIGLFSAILGDRSVMIKIDVEGAELLVANGMKDFLKSGIIEKAVVEIDGEMMSRFGTTPKNVYDAFEAAGFGWRRGMNSAEHFNEIFLAGGDRP